MELEITIKVPLTGGGVDVATSVDSTDSGSSSGSGEVDDHQPPSPESAPRAGGASAVAEPPAPESVPSADAAPPTAPPDPGSIPSEDDVAEAGPPSLDELPAGGVGAEAAGGGGALPPGLPDIAQAPDTDGHEPPSPDEAPGSEGT